MIVAKKYDDLYDLMSSYPDYLAANQARLEVSDARIAQLTAALAPFNAAFANYSDPAKQTASVRASMSRTYKELDAIKRAISRQLKNNSDIELLEQDYSSLDIHKNLPKRTRIPRPDLVPTLTTLAHHHAQVLISVSEPTTEGENRRAMPRDVAKIQLEYAFSDARNPTERLSWDHVITFGTPRHTVQFAEAHIGKWVHMRARYLNYRGEAGLVSATLTTVITPD